MRRQDWTILAGILILAAFMPLAIGGTPVAAYTIGETIVFLMLLAWAAEMRRATSIGALAQAGKFALPIVALGGYVLFQLAPLPPSVLRAVSPAAYQIYARALPDWPREHPYAHLDAMVSATPEAQPRGDFVVLPTLAEVSAGAPIPFAPKTGDGEAVPIADLSISANKSAGPVESGLLRIYGTRWRPLTISPPQTWGALLMLAACGSLFLIVGFFPIGDGGDQKAEASFRRIVVLALLGIGALVAIIGLVQQATWNGKILWFYIPLDWGAPRFLDTPRASGPFVNADHFAGYLAMIFPLALSGVLFPNALFRGKWSAGSRIVCATLGFIIFVAVMMSQSRAGWVSLAVATMLVAWLSIPSSSAGETVKKGPGYLRGARVALGTMTVMLVLATIFVGATGVSQTGARLHLTLSEVSSVTGRLNAWKGALSIIRDSRLAGIGMAAWPELYARYAPAPWSENFFYAAENDYLQFVTELGAVGLILAGWFVYMTVARMARGLERLPSRMRSVEAALIAGVAVIGVIEFFDFDLQIPANGFTFAIILGLAVRLAAGDEEPVADNETDYDARHLTAGRMTAVAAVILLIASLCQAREPYPYNLTRPGSLTDARLMLLLYPANPLSHTWLISFLGERMAPAASLRELETAVWLDPTNPWHRDALAESLARDGQTGNALDEIKTSVFNSPGDQTHPYLSPRIVAWLPAVTQDAIEKGYQQAVAANFEAAFGNLAAYYEQLGQYSKEAVMYSRAADQADDQDAKYRLLVEAGRSSAFAGDTSAAKALLRRAVELEPDNRVAYETLITAVFTPANDLHAVSRIVAEAIKNGVDGYEMWSQMAYVAIQMQKLASAEDALIQALTYRPGSIDDLIRLGSLYIQTGDADRAVSTMEKAVDMRSNSADAYFVLGHAEEAAYDYADAEQAYLRAVDLAPQNANFKSTYADFMKRMKKPPDQRAGDAAR